MKYISVKTRIALALIMLTARDNRHISNDS